MKVVIYYHNTSQQFRSLMQSVRNKCGKDVCTSVLTEVLHYRRDTRPQLCFVVVNTKQSSTSEHVLQHSRLFVIPGCFSQDNGLCLVLLQAKTQYNNCIKDVSYPAGAVETWSSGISSSNEKKRKTLLSKIEYGRKLLKMLDQIGRQFCCACFFSRRDLPFCCT